MNSFCESCGVLDGFHHHVVHDRCAVEISSIFLVLD